MPYIAKSSYSKIIVLEFRDKGGKMEETIKFNYCNVHIMLVCLLLSPETPSPQ